MKRLLILLLCLFVGNSFASGIASNSALAPCTNNTLETYSGNSNLAADWQPNTINISWYNENEKLTVQQSAQSCIYDGGLIVPSTPPTRTGYTFAGWEVRLPGTYTELEYLESTGTQCIDTGVQLTSDNVTYEWEAKDNSDNVNTALFGAEYEQPEATEDGRLFSGLLYGSNQRRGVYVGKNWGAFGGYSSSDAMFHSWSLVINSNHTAYLVKDGTTVSAGSWTSELNKMNSIFLYCNRYRGISVGEHAKVAFKYFKIIDNGNVVFHGIPARRNSDNVLGIYDTVSKTFKTNLGSGTFVAGPDVN